MSGIVGIINTDGAPVDRDLLVRLTASLDYRGPDARAVWIDGHVGFGHTTLRTTDESVHERQPLSLDGHVWVTADARVDGRVELRDKLGGERVAGLDPVTDVELILHAYRRWDTGCVDHLLGDFAFAIWDGRKQRLFCARDHFGVKPFFYARVGNVLLFGNTLNCLRLHPGVSDALNEVAIGDFLLCGQNQDAATTTFADIQRLPGAHCLALLGDQLSVSRYWSLPIDGHIRYKRSSDYVDHFKEILCTAVDDRLRTNRVAVEMSGGLDSTSIAATAKEMLARRGEPFDIRAYSFVYDRLIPDQERHFSGLAAQALAIPIAYLAADDYPLFEPDAKTGGSIPEPYYLFQQAKANADFYRMVAAHGRVLLTGWDGDALLSESPKLYFRELVKKGELADLAGGLGWYIGVKHTFPPMGIRTWVKRRLGRYPVRSTYPSWVDPAFAARTNMRARWAHYNAERRPTHPTRPRTSTMLCVPNWWALFERYDAGVTGLPIDARHPLIDRRLVEYVLAIPPVPWSIAKEVLRVAMVGTLPDAVRLRPKTALAGDPAVELLRSFVRHWLDEFEPSAKLARYVRRDSVPRVAGESNSNRLWLHLLPFTLNRWLENVCPAPPDGTRNGVMETRDRCFKVN